MTTTNDPISTESLRDARDRRIAYWAQAMREPLDMPAATPKSQRRTPRTRRTSVRHRSIR